MQKRFAWLLIFLPYFAGVLAGLYLAVVSTWADLEAAFYGFRRGADSGLRGFQCPVLMTRGEMRSISLQISNPLDVPLRPVVRTQISTPLLPQEFLQAVELAPGETRRLEWQVGPENIDLERFIFAKALVYSAFPLPSRETTCGIFILDLPGSGSVILGVLLALSLAGMGWGLYALKRSVGSDEWIEKNLWRPLVFLAFIVCLGLAVSLSGGWMPSILILAVAVLMIFILLGTIVMHERKG
jgi:hypothetical protein